MSLPDVYVSLFVDVGVCGCARSSASLCCLCLCAASLWIFPQGRSQASTSMRRCRTKKNKKWRVQQIQQRPRPAHSGTWCILWRFWTQSWTHGPSVSATSHPLPHPTWMRACAVSPRLHLPVFTPSHVSPHSSCALFLFLSREKVMAVEGPTRDRKEQRNNTLFSFFSAVTLLNWTPEPPEISHWWQPASKGASRLQLGSTKQIISFPF